MGHREADDIVCEVGLHALTDLSAEEDFEPIARQQIQRKTGVLCSTRRNAKCGYEVENAPP